VERQVDAESNPLPDWCERFLFSSKKKVHYLRVTRGLRLLWNTNNHRNATMSGPRPVILLRMQGDC